MEHEYSLYDAKANFSKIVKQVRENGKAVVITVHGRPAVEIIAYRELSLSLEQRLDELRARGEILPAKNSPRDYVFATRKAARKSGLKRFLAERDDK